MGWSPVHYIVDLDKMGYADTRVTVVVNPRGRTIWEYWDVMDCMAQGGGKDEALMGRYFAVLAELLVQVERGGEVIPLGTAEAVRAFWEEDDPQVLTLAVQGLWAERERRWDEAARRFRGTDR